LRWTQTTSSRGAAGLAIALAAVVFFVMLGPRPDFAAAAETPRFLFKFVVAIILAVSAFVVARSVSWPEETWDKAAPYLAAAPVLIVLAAIMELLVLPQSEWSAKLIGANSIACLTFILLIGIGPLVILLLALRLGAPTRPALSGGIAAAFYAAHCTDDSPLFVATWYTIAIAGLAVIGAAGADRFARW
jgi:hypothetical protein